MNNQNKTWPVNEPVFCGNEKKYLVECIDSGWISSEGPFVKRFEHEFADYINTGHGIAVSSGTAALETALYALGIEPGDEVIMPAFTIISCALACLRLGAIPVLVDIDPDIWTMDVSLVESRITKKTRVVMPVHIYGHPVNMDELFVLKEKNGFSILEDSAEVHGAEYLSKYRGNKWFRCGSLGDISATSFYANKIITTGEGGMVLTNDENYAERARSYRNLAFARDKRFYHTDYGYNFRMTNMQAAIGIAQLEQVEKFIELKRQVAGFYKKHLSDVAGIKFMIVKDWARSVFWMCCVMLDEKTGLTADTMIDALKKYNIQSRPFFSGLHSQPVLLDRGLFTNEYYPNTDYAARYGFYLPSSINLEDNDVQTIVDALKSELKNHAGI
jgi:perosamine synthetase